MAQIIDGKVISGRVREKLKADVRVFNATYARAPALHVVLVSEDPTSAVHVYEAEKAAAEVGIATHVYRLPDDTRESDVLSLIQKLNADTSVDGIVVERPLPPHVRQRCLAETLSPAKDVDGLHPFNLGALWAGAGGLVSSSAAACVRLLIEAGVKLEGARAVVVAASDLGNPIAALLLAEHATVTRSRTDARDLPALCRQADVLVVALGQKGAITADFIKPGAAIIDFGMNLGAHGKPCGDVDAAAAQGVAGYLTRVPGGVGPMIVTCRLVNTLTAARLRVAGGD